jgi:hypothetical protein
MTRRTVHWTQGTKALRSNLLAEGRSLVACRRFELPAAVASTKPNRGQNVQRARRPLFWERTPPRQKRSRAPARCLCCIARFAKWHCLPCRDQVVHGFGRTRLSTNLRDAVYTVSGSCSLRGQAWSGHNSTTYLTCIQGLLGSTCALVPALGAVVAQTGKLAMHRFCL